MHKVSTPSAEMAGSWWFQHVPTDKTNCQGRSIPLHWNLLKKERPLPGWRRGKSTRLRETMRNTWFGSLGSQPPVANHTPICFGRTQVAIKMKPQGGCECSTRGWYTNDMPRAWCMSMYVFIVHPFFYYLLLRHEGIAHVWLTKLSYRIIDVLASCRWCQVEVDLPGLGDAALDEVGREDLRLPWIYIRYDTSII